MSRLHQHPMPALDLSGKRRQKRSVPLGRNRARSCPQYSDSDRIQKQLCAQRLQRRPSTPAHQLPCPTPKAPPRTCWGGLGVFSLNAACDSVLLSTTGKSHRHLGVHSSQACRVSTHGSLPGPAPSQLFPEDSLIPARARGRRPTS